MSQCWAYGPQGKRCQGEAGHPPDEHFLRWTDEECIDPAQAAQAERQAHPIRMVNADLTPGTATRPGPVILVTDEHDSPEVWMEVPDDEPDYGEPPPPGAVIGTVLLEPGAYKAKDEEDGTERPAVQLLAGTDIPLTRKGAAAVTGCFTCGCGPAEHAQEDGCVKHGCKGYVA